MLIDFFFATKVTSHEIEVAIEVAIAIDFFLTFLEEIYAAMDYPYSVHPYFAHWMGTVSSHRVNAALVDFLSWGTAIYFALVYALKSRASSSGSFFLVGLG